MAAELVGHRSVLNIAARAVVRAFLAVTTASMLLLGTQGAAVLAHAELVSSTPADGAELSEPPVELRLVFSERPVLESLSVRLFDRRGTVIELEPASAGPLATTVVVPIPTELAPGTYTVVWSVVSVEDGHPETREFVFGVQEPPGEASVTAGGLTGAGGPLLPVAALLAVAGLTLMLGAAFQAWRFRLADLSIPAVALLGAGLFAGSMLATAAAAPRSVVQISDGSDGLLPGVNPGDLARILVVGLFLLASAAGASLASATGRRRSWAVALGMAVVLAWLYATRTHAAGVGILPWVALAWGAIDAAIADAGRYAWFGAAFEAARQLNILVATIHTVAVGVWVGGLVVASVHRFGPAELAAWHPRFSRVALIAFLVVAGTGLYQAVLYLPAPTALVDSDYGRVLVAKHVFVAGVLAMAALNRFVAGPALRRVADTARSARLATRTLRAEAVIGVAVLAVTGLLATTPPARSAIAVFVRPDIVDRLQDSTVEIAAGDRDARLTVQSVSATKHRLTLSGGELRLVPSAELSVAAAEIEVERRLPLRREGSGWVAEGLAFPRDGVWVVSAPLADGGELTFRLETVFGRVAVRDDAARRIWDEAIERSEREMRSARMIDQLTDGLSVMLFGYHEFAAPDAERFEIQGRFSTITVGGQRYTREAGTDTWTVREDASIGTAPPGSVASADRWPSFGFLREAAGVTAAGEASQAGQRCQVLVGIDPQSDVTYEVWVGQSDGLIHRLVMGQPGHYMVNAYFDVNAPVEIQPPDGPVVPAQ